MTQAEKHLYYRLEDRFNALAYQLGVVEEDNPFLLVALSNISSGGRCEHENEPYAVDSDVELIIEGTVVSLRLGVSRENVRKLVEMTIGHRQEMVAAGLGKPFREDHIQRIKDSLES